MLPKRHYKYENLSLVDVTPLPPTPPTVRPLNEVLMSRMKLRADIKKQGYLLCMLLHLEVQTADMSVNNTQVTDTSEPNKDMGVGFSDIEKVRYMEVIDSSKVFEEKTPSYPPPRPVLHRIVIKDGALPTHSPMYRMGPAELIELKKILVSLLEAGLIEPSNSPYSAGVLDLVPKPNGKFRLVTDYRKLNDITVKSKYPLPRIDDIFNRVKGSTCFTVLDCADGFWQLQIAPEDCAKYRFCHPIWPLSV